MKKAPLSALCAAVLSLPLVGVAIVTPAAADHAPIHLDQLHERATLPDDVSLQFKVKQPGEGTRVVNLKDPSRIVTTRITVQPGARFPLHTHPGPVIVTVAEGQLTYVDPHRCVERVYPAGTAFVDTGDHVHSAYGYDGGVTTLVATFFGAPATGPLTIPEADQTPPTCTDRGRAGSAHAHRSH